MEKIEKKIEDMPEDKKHSTPVKKFSRANSKSGGKKIKQKRQSLLVNRTFFEPGFAQVTTGDNQSENNLQDFYAGLNAIHRDAVINESDEEKSSSFVDKVIS